MRAMLLAATALTGSLAVAMATPAAAQERSYQLDMPAQPLGQALMAFGSSTDQQIVFSESLVKGRAAPSLKGDYTAGQALAMLLADSGLVAQRNADGVVLISRASDPQSGSAAGDGADSGTVQALIVTAQKREEDIQDVPIAISAFTQEDLTRSQVAGGPDLVTQVPNFTFTKTNFSSYSIQIRGIGTQAISATTDPAVAVAFNNTPFIRNRFFEQEFYDLQRVEVLRGPQGTLYGRNATAGVVNIISAKPKFIAEAKASGDLGNFSSSRIEGMINIPLVEDKVALRLAGAWTKRDGYATNQLSGNPIDGRDLWSTRLSLRVQPNDRINANLIWEHFQEDDDRLRSGKQLCTKDVVTEVGGNPVGYFDILAKSGQAILFAGVQGTFSQGCKPASLYSPDAFQTPNGLMLPYYEPLGAIGLPIPGGPFSPGPYVSEFQSQDLRMIESTIDPQYRAKSDLGELQISYDLADHLTLASETAYSTDMVYSLEDFNRFNTRPGAWAQPGGPFGPGLRDGVMTPGPNGGGIFCDPQLGCADRLVAVDVSTATSWQFSQELRLSSDFSGPFNFSLGGNFLRADSEDKYYVFINSLSLIAANNVFAIDNLGPYVVGQSDNSECLQNGLAPGNPNDVYPVTGCIYMDPNPIGSVNDKGHNYFLSRNPYKLISYAVFGEAYYNFAENLKVTAGLRWTVDKKEAPRIPSWILASQTAGYPISEVVEQEWREPTGRLAVDWKPALSFTDETMIYGSYAHGYKAGGANPPPYVKEFYADPGLGRILAEQSATRPKTFDPEFVNAFEVGAKNTLSEGKVTFNLAAFYYDYTGYQVSEIVDRQAFNRNFDATVWGVELESKWRPFENLELGFKAGYEKTRIADGEQAIDLMDRTAGHDDWIVVRPFPTQASSCILPLYVYLDSSVVAVPTQNTPGGVRNAGNPGGGGPGGCELAYLRGVDPQTELPYVPNPTVSDGPPVSPGYPGYDPNLDVGQNHGEGFFKQLGGNELPNAPHYTATVMGDYALPLPNEWLMTLHTDVHWQSQSWWRVFNDLDFDKLHPYFTMNLAAIFTNEEAGWNIMAYIKNVTDETAITGAFLNSDDTGLTTNVFLTEPRLYGLRVTKAWTGGSLLGGFGARRDGPYPFTVELGGQVQRHDAPNEVLDPLPGAFPQSLDVLGQAQQADLDWGDGRDVKLTWRPDSGPWTVSAGIRYGKTNGHATPASHYESDAACAFGDYYASTCQAKYDDPFWGPFTHLTRTDWSDASVVDREEYDLVDLIVGRDVGLGRLNRSTVSFGLRHASFDSTTRAEFHGVPDWMIPEGYLQPGFFNGAVATHTQYEVNFSARRKFSGFGPTIGWDASYPVLGDAEAGHLDVDWSISGGVLFGDQKTTAYGTSQALYFETSGLDLVLGPQGLAAPTTTTSSFNSTRSNSKTIPTVDASVGLSYSVDRFKVGGGYRWERYFDVLDAGYAERRNADRTIDGPYFKIAVGFGG
jgi:outer membrane receptor protein involved in Fe transport